MVREVIRIRLNGWRGRYDTQPAHVPGLEP
jgi:hypothetical protein